MLLSGKDDLLKRFLRKWEGDSLAIKVSGR